MSLDHSKFSYILLPIFQHENNQMQLPHPPKNIEIFIPNYFWLIAMVLELWVII